MIYKRAFLAALVLAVSVVQVEARDIPSVADIKGATADMDDDLVIKWWTRADYVCKNDESGEIISACVDRTELGAILEKRGYCWTLSPIVGDHWGRCMVRGGFGYQGNPSLSKYESDRARYFTQGLHRERSVSPTEPY